MVVWQESNPSAKFYAVYEYTEVRVFFLTNNFHFAKGNIFWKTIIKTLNSFPSSVYVSCYILLNFVLLFNLSTIYKRYSNKMVISIEKQEEKY